MKYCGILEKLADQYNVKLKGKDKISRSHLVLLYVDFPEHGHHFSYNYYLQFNTALASKCDIAITILNRENIGCQLEQTDRFINIMNLHSDLNNTSFNHIYVIKNYLENKAYRNQINNKIKSGYNRYSLDILSKDSCGPFLLKIFNLLNDTEKSVRFNNERFSKVSEQEIDPFNRLIFSDITKVIEKVKENDKVKENITYAIPDEENLLQNIIWYYNRHNDEDDDIINSIKGKFLFLICQSINLNNNTLYSFFLKLQNRIIDRTITSFGDEYFKQIKSKKFIWSEVCQDVFDFINNSVT